MLVLLHETTKSHGVFEFSMWLIGQGVKRTILKFVFSHIVNLILRSQKFDRLKEKNKHNQRDEIKF